MIKQWLNKMLDRQENESIKLLKAQHEMLYEITKTLSDVCMQNVKVLSLRDGDTIVFNCPGILSKSGYDKLSDCLMKAVRNNFPNCHALLIDEGMTIQTVLTSESRGDA